MKFGGGNGGDGRRRVPVVPVRSHSQDSQDCNTIKANEVNYTLIFFLFLVNQKINLVVHG